MKPDKFLRNPAAVDLKRTATAQPIPIRSSQIANVVDIADMPAHEGPLFIYAMAMRNKAAAPTTITVELANGLAVQMIKA